MPPAKDALSVNELRAIRLIRSAIHRGRAPTVRELAAGLGYRSPRSASDILDSLETRGIVRRGANGKLRLTKDPEEDRFRARTVDVPLVGTVAAGTPILAEESIQAMIPVSVSLARPPHRYFLLRVTGDSMNKAGIENGNLVLVRQQNHAEDGDKVVALVDDEATVKVLRRSGDAMLLIPRSTNPQHKPIVLNQDFQVQGVVQATLPDWRKDA
jgi:repressor LexA